MTERKICEKGFTEGVGKFESVWVPLDPQPCCDTCKHLDREYTVGWFVFEVCRKTMMFRQIKDYYCNQWELKE